MFEGFLSVIFDRKDKKSKEDLEFEFYDKFYEELIDDKEKPWCGDFCRRIIKEELLIACPTLDDEIHGKIVLNLGAGCTGVLRMFDRANVKIELDPLVDRYMEVGKMTILQTSNTILLKGYGEKIPVSDEFIDVIVSRNALDHVDNPAKTAREISRVLKPGGLFVLVVDIKERRTSCEPSPIHGSEIINGLFQDFIIEFQDIREIPHYVKFLKRKDIVRPTYYGRLRKKIGK